MKIVIIGGGISGITTGILLHKSGFEVCICEKEDGIPSKGNAFFNAFRRFSNCFRLKR
jgi:2-polyprenyl-6-methoxyphenol hydroxylase-like FAD-dependent oxidoreductase